MSSRRRFLESFAATAAVAATTRGAQAQISPQASVGVVGPFSGPDAQLGAQLQNGVRGALDDANNVRALNDRFWSLRTFDDQDTLASALLVSRFAIDDPGQSATIGHLNGQITSQVVRYYANVNMPLIVPAATTDSITTQGYRNVFRLPTKDSTEGILHARYVKRENRGKRIAVLYQDGDYGRDVASTFLRETSANGLSSFDVKFSRDRPDFEGVARSVVAQNPDLVFLAGLAHDMGPVIPALRAAGFNGQFDGSAGFFDGAVAPSYGNAIDGLIISSSMPPLQIVPSSLPIKLNYEARYGPMTPIAAFAYAATQIWITAVRRFSSTQRIMIARAIAQPIAIDTLVGSFTFDPFGDPNDPNVYFYQLSRGTWHYLRAAHPSSFIVR